MNGTIPETAVANITIGANTTPVPLTPNKWPTGTRGFRATAKVMDETGQKYQCNMNVMAVGSKKWEN